MPKLELNAEGDRDVVITRTFAAPPRDVYRAHTEPALIRQWMLGPPGWTMPACVNDARPGGAFRYEWSDGKGGDFHITGEFVTLVPGRRIEHVERMFLPDPTPDCRVVTTFEPLGAGTRMTMRMTFRDGETRAAMLATGMERGLEASYARLEGMGPREPATESTTFAHLHATPTVIELPARATATIRLNITHAEMRSAFGPAVKEVATALAAQGIAPAGGAFAHHLRKLPGRFDFEVGFVTPRPGRPTGRVAFGEWPAGRHAHAVYLGAYEGLPMAWGEFTAWMKSAALAQADDLYEQYVTGPNVGPDPTQWRTELFRPLHE